VLKSAPGKRDKRDPEGRMPLAEHLRELRNRLLKSVLAVLVVTIAAAFYYKNLIHLVQEPILKTVGCPTDGSGVQRNGHSCAQMTVNGLMGGFSLALKVSLTAGIVAASPVWLYQLWAFLAPGLHRHEKKYALSFVGAGVPLFLGGAWLAYEILPQTAKVMIGFVPNDATNLLALDDFLDLVTRMVIVFGLAFELPLLLVLLNLTGVLSARRMAGWWRGMVVGITVFAAVATPTGDPLTMSLLAAPIVLLYFGAVGIAFAHDIRKSRREAADPDYGLDADEASEIDLTPTAVPEASSLPEAERVERSDGFDDAT
jgi:sec-independent protein translocase protein TatC